MPNRQPGRTRRLRNPARPGRSCSTSTASSFRRSSIRTPSNSGSRIAPRRTKPPPPRLGSSDAPRKSQRPRRRRTRPRLTPPSARNASSRRNEPPSAPSWTSWRRRRGRRRRKPSERARRRPRPPPTPKPRLRRRRPRPRLRLTRRSARGAKRRSPPSPSFPKGQGDRGERQGDGRVHRA